MVDAQSVAVATWGHVGGLDSQTTSPTRGVEVGTCHVLAILGATGRWIVADREVYCTWVLGSCEQGFCAR